MRKLLTFLIALGAIVFAIVSPVSANGVLILAGPKPVATYVGPGDIQTFASWYSCAFVYNAASANTSTQMCDLVATGTTTPVVCTLRGSPSGAVDLANPYCTGSVTPAAACTGGCSVSQAYDQAGGGRPVIQATASHMPALVFSALGTSPCMQFFGTGTGTALTSSASWSNAQPFTGSVVGEKTTASGAGAFIETGGTWGITQGSTNQWGMYTGTPLNITVSDNAFHAFQGTFNGASGAYNLDGTTTSGVNAGSSGASSTISLGPRSGSNITGYLCEAGWAAGDQSALYTAVNSNQHARYGF